VHLGQPATAVGTFEGFGRELRGWTEGVKRGYELADWSQDREAFRDWCVDFPLKVGAAEQTLVIEVPGRELLEAMESEG
jgi:hypothetical protein